MDLRNRPESKDSLPKVIVQKSFNDSSKTFITPNYCNRSSWFYEAIEVDDEVAETADNTTYTFGEGEIIIDLDEVTNRADWSSKDITVKKNGIVQTTGFTINLGESNTVVFDSANAPEDEITVSYSYENGSGYELVADAGKKILLDYVECQFSAGAVLNDTVRFELILNNPNVGNVDYVAATVEYRNAKDFLNAGNNGSVLEPFGELTAKINIFPWNYLTGYTLKPVGDATTDPTKNEFNKMKLYLVNNAPPTSCEISTASFYCRIESL